MEEKKYNPDQIIADFLKDPITQRENIIEYMDYLENKDDIWGAEYLVAGLKDPKVFCLNTTGIFSKLDLMHVIEYITDCYKWGQIVKSRDEEKILLFLLDSEYTRLMWNRLEEDLKDFRLGTTLHEIFFSLFYKLKDKVEHYDIKYLKNALDVSDGIDDSNWFEQKNIISIMNIIRPLRSPKGYPRFDIVKEAITEYLNAFVEFEDLSIEDIYTKLSERKAKNEKDAFEEDFKEYLKLLYLDYVPATKFQKKLKQRFGLSSLPGGIKIYIEHPIEFELIDIEPGKYEEPKRIHYRVFNANADLKFDKYITEAPDPRLIKIWKFQKEKDIELNFDLNFEGIMKCAIKII